MPSPWQRTAFYFRSTFPDLEIPITCLILTLRHGYFSWTVVLQDTDKNTSWHIFDISASEEHPVNILRRYQAQLSAAGAGQLPGNVCDIRRKVLSCAGRRGKYKTFYLVACCGQRVLGQYLFFFSAWQSHLSGNSFNLRDKGIFSEKRLCFFLISALNTTEYIGASKGVKSLYFGPNNTILKFGQLFTDTLYNAGFLTYKVWEVSVEVN